MPNTVDQPIDFKNLAELINKAGSILISSHIMPDGDNIGSICALGMGLRKLGKKVTMANLDPVPRIYRTVPGQDRIVAIKPLKKSVFDLFFLLDCSDETRVGLRGFSNMGETIVNLDHHAGNTMYAKLNIVDETRSSTCEMVYYLLRHLNVEIDSDIATALFTGMVTDTIRFLTNSCTPAFYGIVAELTAAGADPQVIGTDTYMNNTLNGTRLLGHLLSTFELNEEKTLAWCIITAQKRQEHGADIEDTSSVVNHLLAITGVEVAMIFEVEEGMIHLSMRSKTDFDVGVITREIGGGGHLNAAGAAIKGGIPHCRKMISIVNKKLKEHFATH